MPLIEIICSVGWSPKSKGILLALSLTSAAIMHDQSEIGESTIPAPWVAIRGGRGGDRTPGLIVANDALSQLSYTPTVRIILANARSTTKRDSVSDCYIASAFCACAITSAVFVASVTLPCAKSFAPPPLPPNCFSVSRSSAPMSCGNPFVCAKTT